MRLTDGRKLILKPSSKSFYNCLILLVGKVRSSSPLPDVTSDQPPPIGQTVDIIREEPMVIDDGMQLFCVV